MKQVFGSCDVVVFTNIAGQLPMPPNLFTREELEKLVENREVTAVYRQIEGLRDKELTQRNLYELAICVHLIRSCELVDLIPETPAWAKMILIMEDLWLEPLE